ncbi:hypothetical protein KAU11_08525 [Candidatus Babeliales bacterium]|nr:hypothetical protein [Candidatus Babeliales bacterium]
MKREKLKSFKTHVLPLVQKYIKDGENQKVISVLKKYADDIDILLIKSGESVGRFNSLYKKQTFEELIEEYKKAEKDCNEGEIGSDCILQIYVHRLKKNLMEEYSYNKDKIIEYMEQQKKQDVKKEEITISKKSNPYWDNNVTKYNIIKYLEDIQINKLKLEIKFKPRSKDHLLERYMGLLTEGLNKKAFSRKVFNFMTIGDKKTIQHKIIKKDIGAISLNISNTPNVVKQDYIYPVEFKLEGKYTIIKDEIAKYGYSNLQKKYDLLYKNIVIKEDKRLYSLLQESSKLHKNNFILKKLTPAVFLRMLKKYSIKNCLISFDLFKELSEHKDFYPHYNPCFDFDLIMTGYLGTFMGINLLTDGFREKDHIILKPNEMFLLSPDIGYITQRDKMRSFVKYNTLTDTCDVTIDQIESLCITDIMGVIQGEKK